MINIAPENRAFYWSALFFRQLYHKGVRHVVISPGSRSTPLTLAAATHAGLNKHVILDERSAAFLALGIGKATGDPAILVCTSGTALANYYPAVIEARLSGAPLILTTADRPPLLRNTGANQAIDQLKLFGDFPVFFHEAGEPVMQEEDLDRLSMLANQAADLSREKQGPVHLNFPFRKPLEPQPDFVTRITQENDKDIENGPSPRVTSCRPHISLPADIQRLLDQSKQPVVISGPLPPAYSAGVIGNLAEALKAPLLSEGHTHSTNHITGYDGFLRSESSRKHLEPDLILRFGYQPTSKALEYFLRDFKETPHIHFAPSHDWQDETLSTTYRLSGDGYVPESAAMGDHNSLDWLHKWEATQSAFMSYRKRQVESEDRLTDGHVYHHLTPQIPGDWEVFVSNSFPARDSLLFGQYRTPSLFVNRGASGIDGVTSSAMGVSIGMGHPLVLFTGDLAFLHDTNAMLNHKLLTHPVIVVVLNNGGGNIFRMLPIARHEKHYQPYFETPQPADLQHLAQTYGLPFQRIENVKELKELNLQQLARKKGLMILECKTDADASMTLRKALWSFSL